MKAVKIVVAGLATIVTPTKVDPFLPPVIPIIDDSVDQVDFYTDTYYGGFSNSENATITIHFNKTTDRHYFIVKYYNHKTNALITNDSYKLSDYLNSNLTFNYTLRCKGRINNDGLRVIFSTETSEGKERVNKTIRIYPTIDDTIYSYQYVNTAYTVEERIFKLNTTGVKQKESVRFENTIDYLTNDVNNAIDISEVTFTYDEGFPLVNKGLNKYLRILDLDNIFPYLSKDSNGYISVPIECEQNKKDISLKYKFHFYYDPNTLEVSFKSRSGFIETDKFYIPKGKLKQLENATFAVEMPYFGRSGFNVIIPLTFIKDRNYLGLCSDSSHCIVGGIRE